MYREEGLTAGGESTPASYISRRRVVIRRARMTSYLDGASQPAVRLSLSYVKGGARHGGWRLLHLWDQTRQLQIEI